MPIKTNLNIDPYFDDYDVSKKYYRVLFKPGYALQARELNQLQSVLQNQVEQFGSNIYKEGTIIEGCNFTELRDLKYVKITDNINPVDYLERTEIITNISTGAEITREYYYELFDSDSGLRALIITAAAGFMSRSPDLNTFFVRYLNSADNGIQVFSENSELQIQEFYIETDENGIETVYNGNGLGSGVAYDPNDTEQTLYSVATAIVADGVFDPVGDSFGIKVSEGTIFQLGHFLFVDEQLIVVSKYIDSSAEIDQPNDKNVGFIVDETIVNSQIDTSLFDNANGSPNEQAPGADRLMLVPRLVALDSSVADANNDFFTLLRYQYGQAVYIREVSEFNSINDHLARRTFETHGNYVTKPFKFSVERLPWSWDSDANTETPNTVSNEISAVVGPGVAYIKGYRVENSADRSFRIDEISDEEFESAEDQPLSLPLGAFYRVSAANGYVNNIRSMQRVNLLDSSNTVIGSAVLKDFMSNRVYFMPETIRMSGSNTFSMVNGFKDPTGASGKIYFNPNFVGKGLKGLVYNMNMFSIKDTENYRIPVRSFKYNSAAANGYLAVSAGAGETLNGDSLINLLVVHANTNQIITPSYAVISSNQILLSGLGASANVFVYYNATITPTNPVSKYPETVYVKVIFNSSKIHYTLGLPDAFELLEVLDENDNDFTESFILQPRQRPNFYDWSYITLKTGGGVRRPHLDNETDTNILTVKFRVWRHTPVSNGTFFTIDSYAGYEDNLKPVVLLDTNQTIDLRDCIDFRPNRIPGAAYATDAGSANTMANNAPLELPTYTTELFSNAHSYIVPATGTSIYLDYNYYLNRTDVITVDNGGNFTLIKGIPDKKSVAPTVTGNKTPIAKVYVPGKPAYTQQEATNLGKSRYAVTITPYETVKARSMTDIQNMSEQIDRLTYYTTLSLLEQATRDLAIVDDDGNSRFKNGIVVDTFSDFTFADINDPEFDAGLDWGEESLTPATTMRQLDLEVSQLSNISAFGANNAFATLGFNQGPVGVNLNSGAKIVEQPYSTNWRPVSSTAFNYWGTMVLSPDYSQHYNYWTNAALTSDLLNQQLVKETPKLQKYIPVTSSNKKVTVDNSAGTSTSTTEKLTVYKNTQKGKTASLDEIASGYIINQWMRPYMAANIIKVRVWGLRPNTRHFFFFDKAQMTAYAKPARYVNGKWQAYGNLGSVVKSDNNGRLLAEFHLPGQRFFCGSRWLYVLDNNGTWDNAWQSCTSKARHQYTAYSYGVIKSGDTPSLRQVEIDSNPISVSNSVTTRTSLPVEQNSNSPMAQTFFIKRAMCGASECIYAAEVHLHFKRKSATNGITLDIREVVNGYPTNSVLPGSVVHKESSEINLPLVDGSPRHTAFAFDLPIRLDAEKEYALVLTADADDPDYLIFTAIAGRKRYLTTQYYNQDWGEGSLFASTNGTAWNPFPSEDWHFRLYRYNFNSDSGVLRMKTGPYEFISLNDKTGIFNETEMVFAKKGSQRKLTLNVNSDRITSVGANTTGLLVGDYIYVYNHTANTEIEPRAALMKIDGRINSTTISVENPPPWSVSTANSWLVVAGKLQGYDPEEPMTITIENSSARSTNKFEASDTIEGLDSLATGVVGSVDDIVLSYGQLIASKLEDSTNTIKATSTAIDPVSNTAYSQALSFSDDNYFTNGGGVLIKSHSNDLSANSRLQINFDFNRSFASGVTGAKTTSTPILDIDSATINAYTYRITPSSNASCNFVTLPVKLQEGFNAEDFRLWITAHRPIGSDIKVYIRCKNVGDGSLLQDNPWIQLELTEGGSYFSPSTNRDDFKEFVYSVPSTALDGNNVLTYTNSQGVFHGYNEFSLKFELSANKVNIVPRLLDIRGIAFE